MKLTDLDPAWIFDWNISGSYRSANDAHCFVEGDDTEDADLPALTLPDAQGVSFLCPTCFKKNNGPVGTETVLCWFKDRGVPPEVFPGPGRWAASGTSFADLTLSPSVNVAHEHWHGYVENGEIR
jgi:hypothetical protein